MTLQAHDAVIRTGAALGAIAPRRQIAVAGKDRASYLQGLLTNDIQALTAGTGCFAAAEASFAKGSVLPDAGWTTALFSASNLRAISRRGYMFDNQMECSRLSS